MTNHRAGRALPALALIVLAATGCGERLEPGLGTVRGTLPLCYGPAIIIDGRTTAVNLTPRVTVIAVRGQRTVRRETFHAGVSKRYFEITLPSGHYKLTATGAPKPVTVVVRAGRQSTANFRSPGCA